MAVNNYMCTSCKSGFVCKISDIIAKFDEDAKKQLGVDITLDSCNFYECDAVEDNIASTNM